MTLRRDTPDDRDVVVDRGPAVVEREVAVAAPMGDTVGRALRWGPIVAGLLTSLGTFILLTLLAVGIGLDAAADNADNAGIAATIVGSVIALLSFFLGGFVAAWSDGAIDGRRGALDGFMVWALWLVVVLVAGAIGAGAALGEFGSMFGDLGADPSTIQSGALQTFLALALAAAAAALGGVVGTRDEVRTRFGTY
ncbi:MAG TPA: hypothetical protein VH723_00650 [Candidatus Limnocylindrales bacterium]|jgi:hypothetical protein